jgi:transcription elongation factor GreA
VQELLAAADQKPAVLFVLAAHLLASRDAELPYGVWDVVRSFIVLLQSRPSDVLAQRALRFFALDADLLERARSEPASSDTRSFLEAAVLDWRSSDRSLFPWMTRASFESLREEIREVGLALKTTIPEAIRKARELGDLRENAEYAAAKAKQSQYAHRLSDLESKARVVRIIEDQAVSDRAAGPGTEVGLAGEGGEARVYWILGEGDQRHGEGVVSCQAPLGRVLTGRVLGDTVDLGDGSGRFTITSIRIRLPEPAPQARE